MHKKEALKKTLDEAFSRHASEVFVKDDPVKIPHCYSRKEDIEIAGFLTATIAWGNRKSIITNANRIMEIMENSPYEYVITQNHEEQLHNFVHRTFNASDLQFFLIALKNIYENHGGLEKVFTTGYNITNSVMDAISYFRMIFLSMEHEQRSEKHISNPASGSAAKRINMFLRWMVRHNKEGIDFGIWKGIPTSELICPLDVHSGKVARNLGLLNRNANDKKSAELLTAALREFDANDPVKYDLALFGMGVYGY
jgi:uncharacterized protein (TIGR02757 family)